MSGIYRNMILDGSLFPLPAWLYPGDDLYLVMDGGSHTRSTAPDGWEPGFITPFNQHFGAQRRSLIYQPNGLPAFGFYEALPISIQLKCEWYDGVDKHIPWPARDRDGGKLLMQFSFSGVDGQNDVWQGKIFPMDLFLFAFDQFLDGWAGRPHHVKQVILSGVDSGPAKRTGISIEAPEYLIRLREIPGPTPGAHEVKVPLHFYLKLPDPVNAIPLQSKEGPGWDRNDPRSASWLFNRLESDPASFTSELETSIFTGGTDTGGTEDVDETTGPNWDEDAIWQLPGQKAWRVEGLAKIPRETFTRGSPQFEMKLTTGARIGAQLLEQIKAALESDPIHTAVVAVVNPSSEKQVIIRITYGIDAKISEMKAENAQFGRDNPLVLSLSWLIRGGIYLIGGLIGNSMLDKVMRVTGSAPDQTANDPTGLGKLGNTALVIGGVGLLLWFLMRRK